MPVGDGSWSINLVTGYLERGDGRPLSAPGAEPRSSDFSDIAKAPATDHGE